MIIPDFDTWYTDLELPEEEMLYDTEWLNNEYENYVSDLQCQAYEQYKDDQLHTKDAQWD